MEHEGGYDTEEGMDQETAIERVQDQIAALAKSGELASRAAPLASSTRITLNTNEHEGLSEDKVGDEVVLVVCGKVTGTGDGPMMGGGRKDALSVEITEAAVVHGKKSMKPGGGGRFAALKAKLAAKGAKDPAALAASIGRKAHPGKMAAWAAAGRARAEG